MSATPVQKTIEAVWRIEQAKIIASIARMVRDVGLAEEFAHDALVTALAQWPEKGIPDNPGAWLMATGKRRAIDHLRRAKMLDRKHGEIGYDMEIEQAHSTPDIEAALDDDIGDDLLSLVFTACHPLLSPEARVALTLKLIGGLATEEIARAFLVPEPTVAQRIVRAKRTLSDAGVPFEVPRGAERAERLSSVLGVIYLIFNEGYSATAGEDLIRPQLCEEAMRLGRILAGLTPSEPEVHGLVALMEIQASRLKARTASGRRADPARRPEPRQMGPAADPARPCRTRPCRKPRAAARPLHAPGSHRRLPCAGAHRRRDRLAEDRRALPGAQPDQPLARRRAQPRGRPVDGLRASGRAGTRRPACRRAGAEKLPPAAERQGGSADEARPAGRSEVEFERAAAMTRNERERALLMNRATAIAGSARAAST